MRHLIAGMSATVMVALAVPLATPAPAAATYGGYQSEGWATPVRIELYEPTIPIPVDPGQPELDLNLGFTRVRGQTGQLTSLASWMWPGDSVGQGFKTFGEQLGLPAELTDGGYPVQVNASHPGEPAEARQEPFPGAVMRVTSDEEEARAQAGWALGDQISEGDPGGGEPSGGGLPGIPSLPGAPELPALPVPGLGGGTSVSSSGDSGSGGLGGLVDSLLSGGLLNVLGAEGQSMPGIPKELSLLVDIGGMSSTSRTTLSDDEVTTVARSALGEISVVGGLIHVEGLTAVARTSADGDTAKATGTARVGAIRLLGQVLAFDENGFTGAGDSFGVPGLSGPPEQVLAQLGIKILFPTGVKNVDELRGTAITEALRIEIDTVRLRSILAPLPLDVLLDALPQEAAELKNVLDTITKLAPRLVIRLGNANSTTEAVPEFEFDAAPDGDGDGGDADQDPEPAPADPPATDVPADPGAGAGDLGPVDVPAADAGPVAGGAPTLPDNRVTSAGLPPLTTIPGLLFWLGITLGAVAGLWLRRLGLLVLDGGAACLHGCQTGLPDLRKI